MINRKKNRVIALITLGCLVAVSAMPVHAAMEAPGGGDPDWHYDQDSYEWSYRKDGGKPYTGWLNFEGEWYWFNEAGVMQSGGEAKIDGESHYFFVNGNMAWNQYVGMKFYDSEGLYDELYDIRVIGEKKPSSEDKDLLSDYLYQIPRTWQHSFTRSGWEMMFYTDKDFFAAPKNGEDIYYVCHDIDTRNKVIRFTDSDSVLQGWGEYIGFAAGCYEKDNKWMAQIRTDIPSLNAVLKIPEYYINDAQFCFGKVFAAYMDEESYVEMAKLAPKTCRALEEILRMKEDARTRKHLLKKDEKRREEAVALALRTTSHKYGPGAEKKTETE